MERPLLVCGSICTLAMWFPWGQDLIYIFITICKEHSVLRQILLDF